MDLSKGLGASDPKPKSLPFLSLHTEIRFMVYHEVFSRRTLFLYDRLRMGRLQIVHRDLRLEYHDSDESVALLQTCKHIFIEARSLLRRYSPSKLIVSRDLQGLWSKWDLLWLQQSSFPSNHITRLDLNIKCLGEHKPIPRACSGSSAYSRQINTMRCAETAVVAAAIEFPRYHHSLSEDFHYGFKTKCLPDLGGIHHFAHIFASLPALRELHVLNVLERFLERQKDPCTCAIAGTMSCVCGQCFGHCPDSLQLQFCQAQSVSETQAALWSFLHDYFQYALPLMPDRHSLSFLQKRRDCISNTFSDYDTISDLLAHGVHIFLHERIAINMSLENTKKIHEVQSYPQQHLHKGTWQAKFHLSPGKSAKIPAEPPIDPAESPRQRKTRIEKERYDRPATKNSRDIRGERARGLNRSRLSTTHTTPIIRKIHASNGIDGRVPVRSLPERLHGKQVTEFESSLEVKILDEEKFDSIVGTEVIRSGIGRSGRKLGKLRD